MKVSCSVCSSLFEAKRRTAKFCGGTCRQKAFRAPEAEAPENSGPALEIAPKPKIHPLVARTELELDEAGQLDTMLGQTALRLAEKLAGSTRDTGSAMASLSRELRAVMAQALAEGTKKSDSLDELAARRMQRASGA